MAIYAQVILVRHSGAVDQPAILEAARGMGMNPGNVGGVCRYHNLTYFLAGLRLAAIVGIAIATIRAKFGAGGLGVLLFDGIANRSL